MMETTVSGVLAKRYDVVVLGGGPAGLSGALALSRARRRVLVVDGGKPRNAPAAGVHNYLGRDGVPPGELLAAGVAEVTGYGGQVVAGVVTAVRRLEDRGHRHPGLFKVELAEGQAVQTRRLLVTTGLVDELPPVAGVAERWGRDVLHCPYCHGYEVRDQKIGILGTSPMAVHTALMWRQWSENITLFLHTADDLTGQQRDQLAARDITVVSGEVDGLQIDQDRLGGVRLGDGRTVPVQALAVTSRLVARSALLTALGLQTVELRIGETVIGSRIETDAGGATAVPGVWAAGNITDPLAQAIACAAAGLSAGAAINTDLTGEDTAHAVAARAATPGSVSRPRTPDEATPAQSPPGGRPTDRRPATSSSTPDTEAGDLAGAGEAERFWEAHYRTRERVFSGNANPLLVAVAGQLPAGRALDLGSGEGGDAVWLARRGWRVTAVDVSPTALARTASNAAAAGVADRVHVEQHDLAHSLPDGQYDLVNVQYLASPVKFPRAQVLRAAAGLVAAGGLLLIVDHASVPPWSWAGPDTQFPTPQQFLDALELPAGQWQPVRLDTPTRSAAGPGGQTATLTDNVIAVRRQPT